MTAISVDNVVQALADHSLLKSSQLEELKRSRRRSNPKALVQSLVQLGWLTAYQAKHLLQGQAAQLTVGPYVILEPLGEGGMGHVFKGRHPGLDRLAAIKVLRKELLADDEAVQRFLREIKLASQLSKHPHLVHAFDAGSVGGTYFLAMEYIEGQDLDRLVQQTGPLPVLQACDYIRQAALGLQHAHEHGLVHRDIKPANLLVTPSPGTKSAGGGIVKVLDLGLARWHGKGTGPARTILTLTSDGMTMGTVDYMAPEQALDLHRADIRADVYSLGCTFYYLLTGKPPFGSGPLAIKLMRHQQADPPDLKEHRPDVPRGLIPIVRQMMAKNPADRYQEPGELAEALAGLNRPLQARAVPRPWLGRAGRLTGALRLTGRQPRSALGVAGALLLLGAVVWLLPSFTDWDSSGTQPGDALAEQLARQSPLDLLDPARIKSPAPLPEQRPAETVAVMTGHRLAEHYIKFSPNARFLAVCGDPTHHELALYDLAGAEPTLYALGGHTSSLYLAAFSPDSQLVVSASRDQTTRRWSLATLPPQYLGQSPCSPVNSIAFSPQGNVYGYATDQTVYLWTMVNGQPEARATLQKLTGPLAFTDQGNLLTCVAPDRQALRLLDLAAKEPADLAVLPVGARVSSIALAANVNLLATGDSSTAVKLWNLGTAAPAPKNLATASQQQAWTTGISALAISRDGQAAVAGTNYGYLRIWNLSGPEPMQLAQVPPAKDGGRVSHLDFSPDGKILASVSAGWLRLWDTSSGQKLREWNFGGIHTMDFAPDGRHIAIGAHGNNLYVLRLAPPPDRSNR